MPTRFRFVALDFAAEPLGKSNSDQLETTDQEGLRFVAKLAWCRYTGNGKYISGGRFLNLDPKLAH